MSSYGCRLDDTCKSQALWFVQIFVWPFELGKAIALFERPSQAADPALQVLCQGGDVLLLIGGWYVTHTGLMLARRNHCFGIVIEPVQEFCDPSTSR